tara:strand:+ start:152 stop:772 length:621 start_codon:yes stop_codon:yes gene_type:complete
MKEVRYKTPDVLGWLEATLNEEEIAYLWNRIENKKSGRDIFDSDKKSESSFDLEDAGNYFYNEVLAPLCKYYTDEFGNRGINVATTNKHPYQLRDWWVNYNNEGDYLPTHNHHGVYSFVIWLSVPTEYNEQVENTNKVNVSNFAFHYQNILGEPVTYTYEMGKKYEGEMVFFPSQLCHAVYPYFNCKKQRISISGNIELDTSKILP